MRIFLTKRSIRFQFVIILFIVLFLTVITSLFVSNALAVDVQQSESDSLTFSSLGINTNVFSSKNGEECEETIEFNVDIDDTSHNRYSLHLNYMAGASRPSNDFEITVTLNGEHVIQNSIFRFIERDTKQWRHIGIPHEYMKDGTNVVAITISFQSLSTEISTLTLYSNSYFNITGISIIKAIGDYSLSDLVVLPSDTYEDKITGSGSIGGFYSSAFEPQIEFFLQENMTSVTTQLEIMFQKDVPSDCEVTYNIYVNDKALYDEKVFEEGKQQLELTELKAGRNSIRFQILINSYRVEGEGGDQSYNFALKIGDASQLSFSSDSVNTGDNNEISKTGIPNVLLFSLVIGLLLFIPSFLFITFKYRRGLVKEIYRAPKLSYVDSTDSGRIKTLRIREETY